MQGCLAELPQAALWQLPRFGGQARTERPCIHQSGEAEAVQIDIAMLYMSDRYVLPGAAWVRAR